MTCLFLCGSGFDEGMHLLNLSSTHMLFKPSSLPLLSPIAEPHTFCARAPGDMGPAALGRSSGEAPPGGGQRSPGKAAQGKKGVFILDSF